MNRYAKDRRESAPSPVKRIDLNPKKWKPQIAVVAALLAIGIFFLGSGVYQALTKDPGWRQIQPTSKQEDSCASQFMLYYDIGSSGATASVEYREVVSLYTTAAEQAFKLFCGYKGFDGMQNLYTLSTTPNTELEVDPALYAALELLHEHGSREIFLAPVYEQYYSLFNCREDSEAVNFDPNCNEELANFYREIGAFVTSADQIDLVLLGNQRVKLFVSQAYLEYAQAQGITSFVDLFWMEQAFQADYIADTLIRNGYTHATLSGTMGYTRVLDEREGTNYTNILDYDGVRTIGVGRTRQLGAYAGVSYRDYPMEGDSDPMRYGYADGTLRHCYVDAADGISRAAKHDLTVYSSRMGCAELMLRTAPLYIGTELEDESLNELRSSGIYSVFCRDRAICYNDSALQIVDIFTSQALSYTKNYIG